MIRSSRGVRLVEARVTQMELRRPGSPVEPPAAFAGQLRLVDHDRIPLDLYRRLYEAVGRRHHWTSRLLPDEALAAEIHAPGMSVHVLEADGEPAGWFELESGRRPGATRIVHFGIMPTFRGRDLARHLLSLAIERAFATGCEVVTLETNTLDHPAALPLYLRAGFEGVHVRLVSTPAIEET